MLHGGKVFPSRGSDGILHTLLDREPRSEGCTTPTSVLLLLLLLVGGIF
jgi:hypothetical protein